MAHVSQFEPTRLTFARNRAGLSATQLASAAGLSAQSVYNYEAGRQVPSADTETELAGILGVGHDFFRLSPVDSVDASEVAFRARKKMSARAKRQALACASSSLELRKYVDSSFRGLPAVDVPTLEGDLDPETAAGYVRARWGMDDHRPAPNMVHLLESHGVAVFSLPKMEATLDAFSFTWNRRPFVLLSTSKSAERSRFDAAHELGHLVLHGSACDPDSRDIEKEANTFASAFLMPAIGVRRRVKQNPSLGEILIEKKHWRVAALALTYRLHALHLLSDWAYNNNILALGRQGYRNGEPRGIQRESSLLLGKILRAEAGAGHLRGMCQQLGAAAEEVASFTFAVRPVLASSTSAVSEIVKSAEPPRDAMSGTRLRHAPTA